MKLRLDLVLCAVLIATAGSELVAPDALSAEPADQTCQSDDVSEDAARDEAEERLLAQGYSEVRFLAKGCDDVWHALALAEGDLVNLQITPEGAVLTE